MVGGTSLGAPSWAGIIAIVDQGRNLAGLSNLSGATQTLPALYQLPSTDFHAIAASPIGTPWSNSPGFGTPWGGGFGGWVPGWGGGTTPGTPLTGATANTQTGLGTPDGPALVNDLAASTLTSPLPSPTTTPTPSPIPSPTPSPTPTPTPPGGKHHHHRKPLHGPVKSKSHAAAAHTKQVAKQGKPAVKVDPGDHHRLLP